jgi:hypothetical protein
MRVQMFIMPLVISTLLFHIFSLYFTISLSSPFHSFCSFIIHRPHVCLSICSHVSHFRATCSVSLVSHRRLPYLYLSLSWPHRPGCRRQLEACGGLKAGRWSAGLARAAKRRRASWQVQRTTTRGAPGACCSSRFSRAEVGSDARRLARHPDGSGVMFDSDVSSTPAAWRGRATCSGAQPHN